MVKGMREGRRKRDRERSREPPGLRTRAERCVIVTFTLGQVRSIVTHKLYDRNESEPGTPRRRVVVLARRADAPPLSTRRSSAPRAFNER